MLRIESGSVFEALVIAAASLHQSQDAKYDLGKAWFDRVAADAPNALAQVRAFSAGSVRIWDHVLGFVLDAGAPFEVATVVSHLRETDPHTVLLNLLGRQSRPVQRAIGHELIERAADGDAAAQRTFLRLAWPDEVGWQDCLRRIFGQPAAKTRDELVGLLESLDREVVPRYVSPLLGALHADAAEKVRAADELDSEALLRFALDTGYTPCPGVEEVILVPSFVVRPYRNYVEHANQMLFLYPLPDGAAGALGAGPPERLVKLTNALGDRIRLEILAALRRGDLSMKELGEQLDLPGTTLRHHLNVLTDAGLIRPIQTEGGFSSWGFKAEAMEDLADLLDRYLGASGRTPGSSLRSI
jgi:DNA-binding transcriptional ArsR family regulator